MLLVPEKKNQCTLFLISCLESEKVKSDSGINESFESAHFDYESLKSQINHNCFQQKWPTHSIESVPQNKESAMCPTLSGTYYSWQLHEMNKKISGENKHLNCYFSSVWRWSCFYIEDTQQLFRWDNYRLLLTELVQWVAIIF